MAFLLHAPASKPVDFTKTTANQIIAGILTTSAVIAAIGVISQFVSENKDKTSYLFNPSIPQKIQDVIKTKTKGLNLYNTRYLDIIKKYPWSVSSQPFLDIKKIEIELNATHYGLTKVKENIIRTIAMQQVVPEAKNKIICLIGPPGVGKTTIAHSIAKALKRKFHTINAATNEQDLRGMNATFIGSDAGSFTKAMISTGVKNPMILIDEIDKSNSSALPTLLEALDPERNNAFSDTFLGFGIDLSEVFFIATANNITSIPLALRDRMEMIHIDAYSQEEKAEIGRRFLLPKITENAMLPKETLEQLNNVMLDITNLVSKPSNGSDGVRLLKQVLDDLVSRQIKTILTTGQPFSLTPETLKSHIDPYFTQRHLSDPVDMKTYCDTLLKDIEIPDDIFKKIERTAASFAKYFAATTITTQYMEHVAKYPFNKRTNTYPTFKDAKKQLDTTHSGLSEIKELILDYLAGIMSSSKPPQKFLCLSGMPGIGKTTIAESIAAALGKKFKKISFGSITSLSGSSNSSETSGPRAPGALAQALIDAETLNPVILLDELEKAPQQLLPHLLELLDPSQNKAFKDEYLGFEIDLSDVLFIASINDMSKLPHALYDRMQIIDMHPYSKKERIEIGTTKLVPEIAKSMCLAPEIEAKLRDLVEPIVSRIIRYEAGVRGLKRALTIAAEKYARQILEQNETKKSLEYIKTLCAEDVLSAMNPEFLQLHPAETINTQDCVGRVNGMSVSNINGGRLLKLEVLLIPHGAGNLKPNKLMGDMYVESQNRVFSYVKSIASNYNIDLKKFINFDFMFGDQGYINLDGPSSGIAQATALISALTNRTVKQNFAITGAIDMHGNTLPVGGYRDKILGSEQAGIKNIIVPECSRPTIEVIRKDFPDLNIFYVSTVPEALELLLNPA